MKITITNWKKYNPRNDYKSIPWLRFQTNFFNDRKFFGCTSHDRMTYILLLTECAQDNSDSIMIKPEYIAGILDLHIDVVQSAIKVLDNLNVISAVYDDHDRLTNGHDRTRSLRTNETNERTNESHPSTKVDPPTSVSSFPVLVQIWNKNINQVLPQVKSVSAKRRNKAVLIWRGSKQEDYWVKVIQAINNTPFCLGTNDRGWKANFDWLIQDGVPDKVLEGNYGGANTTVDRDKFFDYLKPEGTEK